VIALERHDILASGRLSMTTSGKMPEQAMTMPVRMAAVSNPCYKLRIDVVGLRLGLRNWLHRVHVATIVAARQKSRI
jgi:hypothetical protein